MLLAALIFARQASAQLQVMRTETRVHLRAQPSADARSIRVLRSLERLTPRDSTVEGLGAVRGWLPVITGRGEEGWVAQRYVFDDSSSPAVAPTAVAARSGTGTVILGLASPARAIDTAWHRSRQRSSVMRHDPNGQECGPRGISGGDGETFRRKNRNDYPDTAYVVSFAALRALPLERGRDAAGRAVPADRPFTAAVENTLRAYEGIAVTVTGFMAFMNQKGSVEGTNCKFSGTRNTDWHIALTEGSREPEARGLVVEPTPRFTRRHAKWLRANLWDRTGTSRSASDSVRITGFLFYDPDHARDIGTRRFTMWELHPVTRIEIFRDGGWLDLDDLP